MSDSNSSKKEKKCCGNSCLVGLGCGCTYPLAALFLVLIASWFYIADAVEAIITPVSPGVIEISQESYWKLQEKRLSGEGEKNLVLKTDEFNALLSSCSFPPFYGVFVQKLRYRYEKNPVFLFVGSGWFMRKLLIKVEVLSSAPGEYLPGNIYVNSYKLPATGLIRKVFSAKVSQFLKENLKNWDMILSSKGKISFTKDEVSIDRELLK